MQFYNDINNGNFQNQYDYDLFEARKREKRAIWINASKLGSLLLIYSMLNSLMVTVYYYLVYAYKNHSMTLSYQKVIAYLQGQRELISSSLFTMLGNLFCVFFSLVITVLIACLAMKINFSQMLRPEKKHVKQAAVWFPACMAVNSAVSVIVSFFTVYMGEMGITVPQSDMSLSNPGTLVVAMQVLYVIIIGPIAEEFIYRGIILTLLKPFGKWLAVFTSALIFGLMHGNIPQAVSAFAGAIVFGLVAIKCNSIIPTIIIHIANNFFASYPDFSKVYNLPMWIYYGIMIAFMLAGVYVIFTRISELKIKDEPTCVLSSGQRYRAVFTNVFVIIYFALILIGFIRSFYYANI